MSDIQPGPCASCGLRNYSLSYGGPTICPACDVGDSGPSRMNAQRKRIDALESALEEIRELHIDDIDGSMEPGDDRFRGNKAGQTVQIIDAVL